jgi:hypothetical protein
MTVASSHALYHATNGGEMEGVMQICAENEARHSELYIIWQASALDAKRHCGKLVSHMAVQRRRIVVKNEKRAFATAGYGTTGQCAVP